MEVSFKYILEKILLLYLEIFFKMFKIFVYFEFGFFMLKLVVLRIFLIWNLWIIEVFLDRMLMFLIGLFVKYLLINDLVFGWYLLGGFLFVVILRGYCLVFVKIKEKKFLNYLVLI